jgi:predicted  nucleic acid-binding Zn-ribbon protein
MYRPNLQINRLVIFSSGVRVFDEHFHKGLNVLRGENSSGKSTIMDFLFFGLGGDLYDWREAALNCDLVYLQAAMNGSVITLSREVSNQPMRAMRMYFGDMDSALASGADGWQLFPYARGNKESFSQVIFRLIGLPEIQTGESQTKITVNQILRLLYADQISPIDKIFRFQQFDDATTRQNVGDLLCGGYSDDLYSATIRIQNAGKELTEVNHRVKSIMSIYSKDRVPLTRDWLDKERSRLEQALKEKNSEIENLESAIFHSQFDDRLTLNDQHETYDVVARLQRDIATLREEILRTEAEIEDSREFIDVLQKRLEQLKQSDKVISEFHRLEFQYCPSCLEPITRHHVETACGLCKEPFNKLKTRSRSLKLINEFGRQYEESLKLQSLREEEVTKLRVEMASLTEQWQHASKHYRVAVRVPTTEVRYKLRKLNRDAGYLLRELEGLAGKISVVAEVEQLSKEREALQMELDSLGALISKEKSRLESRISLARRRIEAITIEFLKSDLSRQSTFVKATDVNFEFDGNRIAVNGDSFFSASSMVYLKNSFLAAFLFAATTDPSFLHPRLLIMDTIEDKGMEPERSRNFQLLLRSYSESAMSEHQIIIATSMIADELNNDKYTVGEFYTHTNRTLKEREGKLDL